MVGGAPVRGLGRRVARTLPRAAGHSTGSFSRNPRVGSGQSRILEEFAANRKADRRGYHILCLLVRNAHLASVPAERVGGWLGEILEYAGPYGPRYVTPLRAALARELESTKEDDYKPLVEQLRSGRAFLPTAVPKR